MLIGFKICTTLVVCCTKICTTSGMLCVGFHGNDLHMKSSVWVRVIGYHFWQRFNCYGGKCREKDTEDKKSEGEYAKFW